ncbi:MAG: MFS transporter [Pseudomonadota bacterium]
MILIGFIARNRPWILGGFLLTFLSSFGQTFFISLFSGEIRREYDLSHGDFGGLYMAATLMSAATLPFFGRLIDLVSLRAMVITVFLGLALFCVLMASVSSWFLLFIAIYGLRLFGQGMMTNVALTAIGRWFDANRGKAVAVSSAGHQASEAILPISFVALSAAIGWRESWIVAALILAVLLPLAAYCMSRPREPESRNKALKHQATRDWTRKEALRDTYFWAVLIAVLTPGFIGTTLLFHQVHIIETKGWPFEVYAASYAIMSVSTLIFAILYGGWIDRFGAVRMMPTYLIPLGLACLLIAFVDEAWVIAVFMAIFGISYGGSIAVLGALWPEIYGTRHLGAIRSYVIALQVFATAAGPGITGILIDRGVALTSQFFVMGLYCFAAFVLMLAVSNRLMRRQKALNAPSHG